MKHHPILPTLVVFVLLGLTARGQEISRSVVAASGGYQESADASLSWTLGELATETLISGPALVTQGFQQGRFLFTRQPDPAGKNSPRYRIYPNPARNYVLVESLQGNAFTVSIMDASGRCIKTVRTENKKHRLDVSGLKAELYFFQVRGPEGRPGETLRFERIP